jgi:ribosomal protein L3 glutamine methyltransferase
LKPDLSTTAIQELKTLRDMVRWGATEFQKAQLFYGHGFDNAWDEALFLAASVLHLTPQEETKAADARLLSTEKQQIAALYQRRIAERKPVAYLTNEAWFAGLPFYVDERVIIPRSPIAELIEQGFAPYLDETEVLRVLDLCTGSGCIAIACALAFPEAMIYAVDISPDALNVAKKNVEKHQLQENIRLIQSNLLDQLALNANNFNTFDLIVSNPPYVDAAEMANLAAEYRHEPTLALEAGENGLLLVERIIAEAPRFLAPGGILVVEVGNSAAALCARFPELPFLWLEFSRGGDGVFLLTKEQLEGKQQR